MRCFVRTAELQSFSGAARALGITQPTVSKAIAALEERLGARLLQRTTRSLRLTEEGSTYYRTCVRTLGELDEAEATLAAGTSELRGRLRVSTTKEFGHVVLTPLVLAFLERHSGVEVDLVLDDRRLDLTAEGIDVALRFGALDDSSDIARRVGSFARRIVAAPRYLERCGTPERPEALGVHECLVMTSVSSGGHWRFTRECSGDGENEGDASNDGERPKERESVAIRVSGRLRSSSHFVVCAAALAGEGIVLAPEWMVGDDVAAGRLVPVLSDWDVGEMLVSAVWPGGRFVPARVRAFVDIVREALTEAPRLPG